MHDRRARTAVAQALLRRLRDGERITFADYMQLAVSRYYASGPDIGARGDFYTAANLPGFGAALARFVIDARERLGGPDDFALVEIGGGTGALARAMRDALRAAGLEGRYRHVLVEPSPALAARQRMETGLTVVEDLSRVAPLAGVLLANEVLDALPAHRVTRLPTGELAELYLALDEDRIVERPGPLSAPALAEPAEGVAEGEIQEVSLVMGPLMRALSGVMDRGYALLLDYGDEIETTREARPFGTARTYAGHRAGSDPFAAPGEEDLTVDVDFTHAQAAAREAGFEVAGYATQGAFLMDLGIADLYAEAARADPVAALQMKTLFLPGGMGERFKALALAKDAPASPPLAGFRGGAFMV